jgi:hypothetical protein
MPNAVHTGKARFSMAATAKKTQSDYLRELERSQPEEVGKAERVVGKPGAGSAPVSIRLSKPLLERLDLIAGREHRTRANLIQHILWTYVHQSDDARKSPR